VFAAVGALTSQLAATRRQAAAYAAAVLGVSYALRMVADSGTSLGWLQWATPLGWIEELQPLTNPRPWPLVLIAALVIVLTGLAVHLAGSRDLGASTLPDRDRAKAHTRLLSGPTGLVIRLVRPTAIGWAAALGSLALMSGLVAKSAGAALAGSSSAQETLARLGGRGAGADAYLGVSFLIVATLVALIAAGQVSAARGEEADSRLDHLLARAVSRWRWLAGRVLVTAVLLVVCGLIAGICAWLAATSQHAGVSFIRLVEAGINVVPPALFVLGVGVGAFGIWPRRAPAVCYAVLTWSFLVQLIGGIVNASHWVLDTSVFHHMASAPPVSPNWTSAVVLVFVGLVCAGIGAMAFNSRDLVSE
jgi:ABC-2 type transport system permease protein